MERKEEYLRNTMKYIKTFAKISGLHCNISKTKVIPIGDFNLENKLCPDINLDWEEDFTLLGFYIDNKLEKLGKNLEKINKKVSSLINTWKQYNLSVHGRITIAKAMLISQYIYVLTILDIAT